MLVSDIMVREVVTAPSDATLASVYADMRARNIRHVPIVDEGRLVGVVTDRDLRLATSTLREAPLSPGAAVSQVMTRSVRTADPNDPVEDAARVMRALKIGCLPVLDGDQLVGIVTGLDLLDALLSLTGATKPGSRLEVELLDQPGELARLATYFGERGHNLHSVLTAAHGNGTVRVVVRLGSLDSRHIANELRAAGTKVLWPPGKP
jgi:acetoin utilization protein AcuB